MVTSEVEVGTPLLQLPATPQSVLRAPSQASAASNRRSSSSSMRKRVRCPPQCAPAAMLFCGLRRRNDPDGESTTSNLPVRSISANRRRKSSRGLSQSCTGAHARRISPVPRPLRFSCLVPANAGVGNCMVKTRTAVSRRLGSGPKPLTAPLRKFALDPSSGTMPVGVTPHVYLLLFTILFSAAERQEGVLMSTRYALRWGAAQDWFRRPDSGCDEPRDSFSVRPPDAGPCRGWPARTAPLDRTRSRTFQASLASERQAALMRATASGPSSTPVPASLVTIKAASAAAVRANECQRALGHWPVDSEQNQNDAPRSGEHSPRRVAPFGRRPRLRKMAIAAAESGEVRSARCGFVR